ncbi:MAG: hypothetical protein ACERK6_00445, partial [Candidatus Aminicenantaceae bacterium]
MKKSAVLCSMLLLLVGLSFSVAEDAKQDSSLTDSSTYQGLRFRTLGPALMSGRISDIAIHPQDKSIWYIAVGSGGVWKTVNAGTTWMPVFDGQPVYSIG